MKSYLCNHPLKSHSAHPEKLHKVLIPWEDEPVNNKETNVLPTLAPLQIIVSLMNAICLERNGTISVPRWYPVVTWWRHQMEKKSALLAICAGNSPVPVNSPHKGQWRGALMFSLICAWINGWVNNREAGDLRRYHAHYDVIVMNSEWI